MVDAVIKALEGKKAVVSGSYLEVRRRKTFPCESFIQMHIQCKQKYILVSRPALPNSESWWEICILAFSHWQLRQILEWHRAKDTFPVKMKWILWFLTTFSVTFKTFQSDAEIFSCAWFKVQSSWELRGAPTALSTRIKPHPEGRPNRSAIQKIWSSARWQARGNYTSFFYGLNKSFGSKQTLKKKKILKWKILLKSTQFDNTGSSQRKIWKSCWSELLAHKIGNSEN